ncbi:uncharacterized protein LOC135809150 isoform X2 [Sycon ciliatum]|uniref:uncharacterized protein LOC135809150 isoform X2 n=1 Tax=Sycon ciliatum TaxID=27933 RepID=UPI0031F6687F
MLSMAMQRMVLICVPMGLLLGSALVCGMGDDNRPNIIFLLTDDQDVTAGSLDYMPRLNQILRREGTEFLNYFVSTGLCCPSRATIMKGQFCHNTKIFDNGDLNNKTDLSGGFVKYLALGLMNESTVGNILQAAGYETKLCGKYLNGYDDGQASIVPPGWDHWQGMTKTAYYGPHFSINGKLKKMNNSVYQTDYIRDIAIEFIQRKRDKPFFMYLSPFAPHAPATPAKRHAHMFNDSMAPRYDSFNPNNTIQSQKPSWLGRLPPLTQKQIDGIDNFFRNRLRSLQAVDEMLGNITATLESEGLLNNTYIFYMGDNGQHLGDYRLPGGKRQAYDTDIRVPFLAGTFRSVALAEMYGGSSNMGANYKGLPAFWHNRFWNNTYQGVRVINGTGFAANANWLYVEWCTGEKEFYDAAKDPRMILNKFSTLDADTQSKLSSLTQQMGSCVGDVCRSASKLQVPLPSTGEAPSTLKCHNPPNLTEAAERFYQPVFPYADSDTAILADPFEVV